VTGGNASDVESDVAGAGAGASAAAASCARRAVLYSNATVRSTSHSRPVKAIVSSTLAGQRKAMMRAATRSHSAGVGCSSVNTASSVTRLRVASEPTRRVMLGQVLDPRWEGGSEGVQGPSVSDTKGRSFD
jgi:hypothetical protein